MPTAKEFAREVEALALTVTGYQTGKNGQNGLCDCIGLIMGAMANLGRGSYPMHSTNYFARYQMTDIRPTSGPFSIGQVVYKARDDQSDLNDRYKAGGRYYTGDLLDYYHVGVVTDTDPVEITHCTQDGSISGIKRDNSAKNWTHVGELRGVSYAVSAPEEENTMSKTAYVTATNGLPVRMRKAPGTDSDTIAKLQIGTVVEVVEVGNADGEAWATIIDPDGRRGYMMEKFLLYLEHADEEMAEDELPRHDGAEMPEEMTPEPETDDGMISITLPKSTALELYRALMKVVDG